MPLDLSSLVSAPDSGGGFDLSSLAGNGGFDINRFTNQAAAATGYGGVLSMAGSGAALGGTLGTVVPGLGNALGAAVGGIAGAAAGLYQKFFGGSPRVPFGSESNDAAPHRGAKGSPDYLDMTDFAQDNGNEIARWAIEHNCTVEDIAGAINYDHSFNTENTWAQTVAWWRTHPESLTECLNGHFSRHPELRGAVAIRTNGGVAQPLSLGVQSGQAVQALTGATYPLGSSPAQQQAAAASAAGMSLQDYLKALAAGLIKGAQQGAGDAISDTPAGQQIKKDTINGYIKDYQLPLAAAGAGLVWLIYKAFNK